MPIMGWCSQRVGVLVASVRNLAFLVLPKHWQAAWLAGRQRLLRMPVLGGTLHDWQAAAGWDLGMGHGIDCSRQHRTGQRVKPVQAFARSTGLDMSPFQIKFRLSASLGVDNLPWAAGRLFARLRWVLGVEICILLAGPMSLCDPVHDEQAPRRVRLWACRGSDTMVVAANVGKNGTGDCARDTDGGRNYR